MSRYKIVKMDKKMSTEELEGYKNFDALLKTHNKSIIFKRVLVSVVVASIVISAAIFWHPIIDTKIKVNNIEFTPSEKKVIADSAKPSSEIDTVVVRSNPTKDIKKKVLVAPKKVSKKKPALIGDNQEFSFKKAFPTYGMDSLMNYFNGELKRKNISQIQGSLLVAFEIDSMGKPTSIKILQSLSEEVDIEIIELINTMPLWQPAIMNGKAVSSTTTLPIKVEIKRTNN